MGLDRNQKGALVIQVFSGSPAEKAGLVGSSKQVEINGNQATVGGDVITALDGQPVNDMEDVIAYLARYTSVGQTINLQVLRDGKSVTVPLTLAAGPQTQPQATNQPQQPQWASLSGHPGYQHRYSHRRSYESTWRHERRVG